MIEKIRGVLFALIIVLIPLVYLISTIWVPPLICYLVILSIGLVLMVVPDTYGLLVKAVKKFVRFIKK